MQCHEDNTAAKYMTRLPGAIDLSIDWELALSEIAYPCELDYVKEEECTLTQYDRGDTDEAGAYFWKLGKAKINASVPNIVQNQFDDGTL